SIFRYIRFDLYPPKDFEKYIRLLGVNNNDHVVLYGRGSFAGMLWPARAWWTFKLYGHDKVSVLDGGLEAWKKAGQPVASGDVVVKPGNFTAKPIDSSMIITFEELAKKSADGKSLFEELDK
ncbi:Rhodanese domain-containing protein, partial [Trichostrongylus colubriformis]